MSKYDDSNRFMLGYWYLRDDITVEGYWTNTLLTPSNAIHGIKHGYTHDEVIAEYKKDMQKRINSYRLTKLHLELQSALLDYDYWLDSDDRFVNAGFHVFAYHASDKAWDKVKKLRDEIALLEQ